MAEWHQQPEAGQKFWKEGMGSGKITAIDYREKVVYVSFFDKGDDTFSFDEILGCWTDTLGGTWMLYNI